MKTAEQLDWRTASFRFPQSMADFVPEMLEEVTKEDMLEMRRRGKVFLDRINDAQGGNLPFPFDFEICDF